MFWKVFNDVGVVPDARSYLEALERFARSKKRERSVGLQFAEQLWENWLARIMSNLNVLQYFNHFDTPRTL